MNSKHTYSSHFSGIIYIALVMALLVSNSIYAQSTTDQATNTHDLSQESSKRIRHWYYQIGDDPTWSNKDLNMDGWKSTDDQPVDGFPSDIQWYRADIQLEGAPSEVDVLAVSVVGMVSAFELYWDGILIETSGTVADSFEKEVPGPIQKSVPLRRELTNPGNHTLAIRLSNFHTSDKRPLGGIDLGNHYTYLYDYSHKTSSRVFVGGASLIAGLFCIAMFFAGSRHRSYLLFAVYCLISLFFNVYNNLSLYNEISVEHIQWIYPLARYGGILSILLFVNFVIFTYEIPRKAFVIPFAILVALVSIWMQSTMPDQYRVYYVLLPTLAGILLLYAIYRKIPGSIAAFVGVIIWQLFKYPDLFSKANDNYIFFYGASDIVFLFCIVLSISRMIHAQNQQLQEIKLHSSRLEVDLLKKNIQPHFILNTLQSVMSWIKKNPDNACQLIEALAEEFRMINRIADKKLIPLHQEIDLCETHLKLMGFRMGSTYELITEGLCEDEQVPPMIFHTLIENALTHSFRTRERGVIRLACERSERQTVYHLSNNGSRLRDVSRESKDEIQEGMGLKYIKARLNESYANKWSLDYALDDEQWKVTIAIGERSSK